MTMIALSWPTFAAPGMAWALLLVPFVLLLWFLKLRRPRLEVPSLVLWQRVLEDQRVNSPLRRLKRNILLLLQLLAVLLLALALLQPEDQRPPGDRVLVLLDRSASMAAKGDDGRTTLQAAQGALAERVDALGSGQEMALVVFDRRARLAVPYTTDRDLLKRVGSAVQPVAVGSDLKEALDLALGLSRSEGVDRAVLLSDGNVPPPDTRAAGMPAALPFPMEYQRLQPPRGNIGITALRARRGLAVAGEDGGWKVYVEARGDILGTWQVQVQAAEDAGSVGRDVAALEMVPDGNGVARVALDVPQGLLVDGAGVLTFTLRSDSGGGEDALPGDDRAWLALTPPRPLRVGLGAGLPRLEALLKAFGGIELTSLSGAADGSIDLAITADAVLTGDAPLGLVWGPIPEDLTAVLERVDGTGTAVDWERTAPLLEHVRLEELTVRGRVAFQAPSQDAGVMDPRDELEARGYRVLVDGGVGPLLLRQDSTAWAGPRWHVLFAPEDSTLPYRVGFPILVANALTQAQSDAGLLEVQGITTGVLAVPGLPAETEVTVVPPDGPSRAVRTLADGRLPGVAAEQAGIWRLQDSGGGELAAVGASLLDPRETGLASRDRIAFAAAEVAAGTTPRIGRPWWHGLAIVALLLLLVEWWWFNRRPHTARPGSPRRQATPPARAASLART